MRSSPTFRMTTAASLVRRGESVMRISVLIAALFVSAGAIAAAPVADAAGATKATIHIPPQDLDSALQSFAKTSGLHVISVSEDVRNLRTAGVSGEMTKD